MKRSRETKAVGNKGNYLTSGQTMCPSNPVLHGQMFSLRVSFSSHATVTRDDGRLDLGPSATECTYHINVLLSLCIDIDYVDK